MKRKIKTNMVKIAIRRAFKELREHAKEEKKYWADRNYEEICGMIKVLWYERQLTESQYTDICNIALDIAVYGYCRPSKERKAA